MEIEQKARESAGSLIVTIPANLVKWLEMKAGDTIVFQDETGKHGKFMSVWVKKE